MCVRRWWCQSEASHRTPPHKPTSLGLICGRDEEARGAIAQPGLLVQACNHDGALLAEAESFIHAVHVLCANPGQCEADADSAVVDAWTATIDKDTGAYSEARLRANFTGAPWIVTANSLRKSFLFDQPPNREGVRSFKSSHGLFWLRGTHRGVSTEHLQVYLDEFIFRDNRRHTPMTAAVAADLPHSLVI